MKKQTLSKDQRRWKRKGECYGHDGQCGDSWCNCPHTSKEKVLGQHPKAYCFDLRMREGVTFEIQDADKEHPKILHLGLGDTRRAAWKNAAENLRNKKV